MRLRIALIVFLLIVVFQNCVQVGTGGLQTASTNQSFSGNGGGYDGKLSYYRFIPNYTCNGQETFKDRLVVEDNGYFLIENSNSQNNCSQSRTQLNLQELTLSPFQSSFIVARDFLYATYDLSQNRIPELLAEGMCRDNWDNPSFEIVTHYNYRSGEAESQVYEFNANGSAVSKVSRPTQRVLSNQYVKYTLFDGQVEFEILFNSAAGEYNRRYSGQVTKMNSTDFVSLKSGSLTCVTGGGLDRSVWPLKKIDINSTVFQFFSHPTREEFYFTDKSNYNPNCYVPFVKRQDGKIEDIGQQLMGTEMCAFDMYPIENTDYVAVPGNKSGGYYWGSTVYAYNPKEPTKSHMLVFNNNQSSSAINNFPSIASRIYSNGDGKLIFLMKKNNALNSTTVSVDTYYRIFNTYDGTYKDYLKTTDQNSSYEMSFAASELKTKVNYAGYVIKNAQGQYSIKYLDLENLTENSFPLSIKSGCNLSEGQSSRAAEQITVSKKYYISKSYKKLILQSRCENPYYEQVQIYDLLNGSLVKSIEGRAFWNARFPDLLYTIKFEAELQSSLDPIYKPLKYITNGSLITELDSLKSFAINLDYQQFIPSEYLYDNPFTKVTHASNREYIFTIKDNNNSYLLGFSPLPAPKLLMHDLTTHKENLVCENFQGYPMQLEKIRDDLIVLLTMQPGEYVNVYQVKNAQECVLLNSAPTKKLVSPASFVTDRGIGLVLRMKSGASLDSILDELPDEVLYISFDGRPPLYLNLEDQETAYITSIQLSKDLSKLYLLGKSNLRIRETNFYWLPIVYF